MATLMVVTGVLPACGPTPTVAPQVTQPAKLSVGIILPTKDEPRWIQDETRFSDAFEAAGYDVQILFSQGDSAKERANVQSLIAQGVKVIVICPQDATPAAAAAEARAAGVKVIPYDRLIRDADAVDYYVTFDSISVGEAQANYLVGKATGTGNPLYLYAGAASDNNAFLFFEGGWNVLQPKVADGTFVIKNSEAVALQGKANLTREEMGKIIGQVTTEWKFDVAKNLAEANLTAASAADNGGPQLWERCRGSVERSLDRGRTWVLEDRGEPVACSSFNTAIKEAVQVGGVWTPPELRRRGYGRAVVAVALLDARREGVEKAILFTGESNFAAQKAYVALGFQHIGDYRLMSLRAPLGGVPARITID
jgi:ABC-type sugar transport system substrate-binding protein/N-acetylglutamate synthase-like GNAT family acetyltransferase